ncbi:hypothetical protein Q5P01_005037 [Channa striata]|uniref:Lebercilin domain-containing protein n=1 Tax=Channa striata TaxID=64152 RepID=A0AA88T6Y1_CHASR|nr:hypothetical protein Q5P01_005037 [Channa striata]
MESELASKLYEDNTDDISPQSLQSTRKDSRASFLKKHNNNFQHKNKDKGGKDGCEQNRSITRTSNFDPDQDCISDKEEQRSSGSFYSEDYENESPERSLSPYSRSQTPSPTPQRGVRAKRISSSPVYKTGGVGHRLVSRPQRPGGQRLTQHRRGGQSQNKESPLPKDLDLVTKRMLSARLLKISELRNALAELQQCNDELQKENRILRRLQVRQEKALQRYDDTESEISQLLSRHSNEMHVLRERLRRTQERERAAERRLRDTEEQLQKSQATIGRLKKLVDQRELGPRDELSRRLEEEKTRVQEAERKIKELERSMELSNSSYQRQLVAERKKNVSTRDEIGTLQKELERLTNKLREKEKELVAKNIYANRMVKEKILRKDTDGFSNGKVPSRNSTKAVQTEDRMSSLDFPTPPPAITDAPEYNEQSADEYLSLRELGRVDRQTETEYRHQSLEQQKVTETEKERVREREPSKEKKLEKGEKQQLYQELNVLEDEAKRLRESWEKELGKENRKNTSSLTNQKEEEIKKHGHVQEEVERWNQASLTNQQQAEEAQRKKEQLLAKMLEINHQNQGAQDSMYAESRLSESNRGTSAHLSPRPPEQRNHNASVFSLTEPEGSAGCRTEAGSREGGRRKAEVESGAVTTGIGRRALRNQITSDDLAFGNYAPSFGHSASRGTSGFPSTPPKDYRDSAVEIGISSLRGLETEKETETEKGGAKDRKSSLMQQLFGESVNTSNKLEILNSPPIPNGIRLGREGLLSFNSGSSTPPKSTLNTLHVADSRPAIRAITSFDDDIEELTL